MTFGAEACGAAWRVAIDELGDYFYSGTSGRMGGIDYDLLSAFSQRLNHPLQIQPESVVRILRRMSLNEIDVSTHKFPSAERARIAWLIPYLRDDNAILMGSSNAVTSPDEFLAHTDWLLAAGKGWSFSSERYTALLNALRSRGRLIEAADVNQMYAMLRTGRVQAIITTPLAYRYMLSPFELTREYQVERWMADSPQQPVNLMLSRTCFSEAQEQQIAAILQEMKKDGTLLRIFEKYVSPEEAQRMLAP